MLCVRLVGFDDWIVLTLVKEAVSVLGVLLKQCTVRPKQICLKATSESYMKPTVV